jgi:hypothetical protein
MAKVRHAPAAEGKHAPAAEGKHAPAAERMHAAAAADETKPAGLDAGGPAPLKPLLLVGKRLGSGEEEEVCIIPPELIRQSKYLAGIRLYDENEPRVVIDEAPQLLHLLARFALLVHQHNRDPAVLPPPAPPPHHPAVDPNADLDQDDPLPFSPANRAPTGPFSSAAGAIAAAPRCEELKAPAAPRAADEGGRPGETAGLTGSSETGGAGAGAMSKAERLAIGAYDERLLRLELPLPVRLLPSCLHAANRGMHLPFLLGNNATLGAFLDCVAAHPRTLYDLAAAAEHLLWSPAQHVFLLRVATALDGLSVPQIDLVWPQSEREREPALVARIYTQILRTTDMFFLHPLPHPPAAPAPKIRLRHLESRAPPPVTADARRRLCYRRDLVVQTHVPAPAPPPAQISAVEPCPPAHRSPALAPTSFPRHAPPPCAPARPRTAAAAAQGASPPAGARKATARGVVKRKTAAATVGKRKTLAASAVQSTNSAPNGSRQTCGASLLYDEPGAAALGARLRDLPALSQLLAQALPLDEVGFAAGPLGSDAAIESAVLALADWQAAAAGLAWARPPLA